MFDPSWDEGCKSCSFWVDNFDGIVVHLNHRDVSFALVSRAPCRGRRLLRTPDPEASDACTEVGGRRSIRAVAPGLLDSPRAGVLVENSRLCGQAPAFRPPPRRLSCRRSARGRT